MELNWDAIAASAEGLGAIAVIISIIYLAAQVRQTRLQLQAQAEDNIVSRAFDAYSPIYDGNNASIFRRGLENPEALNEDEAFVFRNLMDRQRGAFGAVIRNRENGAISKEMAAGFLIGYRRLFLETEGGQRWFARAKTVMSEEELAALGVSRTE